MEDIQVKTEDTSIDTEPTEAISSEIAAEIKQEEEGDGHEVVVKKRRLELEFDLALIQFEPRKRKSVQRYVDTQEQSKLRKQNEEINENSEDDSTNEVTCDICLHKYHSVKSLKHHKRCKHTDKPTYTCALCSMTFETNLHLIKHKYIHKDEERTFLCKECKSAFSDHFAYLKHQANHKPKKKLDCDECGKVFETKNQYRFHLQIHFDNLVKCNICAAEMRPISLKRHIELAHSSNGKLECVECFKHISVKWMEYHMSTHTGVKPYQCLYCGKGFPSRSYRKIHTATHVEERLFQCDICKFKFKQQADLKRHLNIHLAKKIACHICGQTYKSQKFLNYHMDVHNNTEKYSCKFCGKKLNNTTSLRSHIERTHMESRKYKCVPCNTAFKTVQDLTRHKKKSTKHKNNVYRLEKAKENLE